jgi:hypothetical protein
MLARMSPDDGILGTHQSHLCPIPGRDGTWEGHCRVYLFGGASAVGTEEDALVVYTPKFRSHTWNVTFPHGHFSWAGARAIAPEPIEESHKPLGKKSRVYTMRYLAILANDFPTGCVPYL